MVHIPLGHWPENKSQVAFCVIRQNHRITGLWTSLAAQTVKHLPAMQETWVRFLGWEDPLEKEMSTHSSILAW